MINYRTQKIKVGFLRELMQQMAAAAGCDAEAARTIAETHLESDLRSANPFVSARFLSPEAMQRVDHRSLVVFEMHHIFPITSATF